VLPVAMIYAGKEPYSKNAKDYDAAREVLKARARSSRGFRRRATSTTWPPASCAW
jgi:hypothetical protein